MRVEIRNWIVQIGYYLNYVLWLSEGLQDIIHQDILELVKCDPLVQSFGDKADESV